MAKTNSLVVIDVESEQLATRNKKDGSGTYQVQTGYLHETDRDGQPKRYPTEFQFYAPQSKDGSQIAYKVGSYTVPPAAFQIKFGQLQLGFLTLIPVSDVI